MFVYIFTVQILHATISKPIYQSTSHIKRCKCCMLALEYQEHVSNFSVLCYNNFQEKQTKKDAWEHENPKSNSNHPLMEHAHSTTREDISLPVSQFDSSEPSEHCGYPSHRHHTGTQLPSWHWKSPDVHVLPQCGSIFFPVQNISLLSQKSEGLSFPILLAKANGSSCSYLDHLPSKDFDPSKGVL